MTHPQPKPMESAGGIRGTIVWIDCLENGLPRYDEEGIVCGSRSPSIPSGDTLRPFVSAALLDRAIALLHGCVDDPANGVALAKIYLEELDPDYVKPTF